MSKRKKYSEFEIDEAFALMSKGVTCSQISRMLDISEATLRTWKNRGVYFSRTNGNIVVVGVICLRAHLCDMDFYLQSA